MHAIESSKGRQIIRFSDSSSLILRTTFLNNNVVTCLLLRLTSVTIFLLHEVQLPSPIPENIWGGTINVTLPFYPASCKALKKVDGIRLVSDPWYANTEHSTAPLRNVPLKNAECLSILLAPILCNSAAVLLYSNFFFLFCLHCSFRLFFHHCWSSYSHWWNVVLHLGLRKCGSSLALLLLFSCLVLFWPVLKLPSHVFLVYVLWFLSPEFRCLENWCCSCSSFKSLVMPAPSWMH